MNETNYPLLPQDVDHGLEEMDRILHQMLLLAELSASNSSVDRQSLQKILERMQSRLDRIADRLSYGEN